MQGNCEEWQGTTYVLQNTIPPLHCPTHSSTCIRQRDFDRLGLTVMLANCLAFCHFEAFVLATMSTWEVVLSPRFSPLTSLFPKTDMSLPKPNFLRPCHDLQRERNICCSLPQTHSGAKKHTAGKKSRGYNGSLTLGRPLGFRAGIFLSLNGASDTHCTAIRHQPVLHGRYGHGSAQGPLVLLGRTTSATPTPMSTHNVQWYLLCPFFFFGQLSNIRSHTPT